MNLNKYRSSKSSTTVTIGELYLHIKSCDASALILDTAVACEFEVEIEYTYTPGYEGNTTGRWEDAEEGVGPELTIDAIKASANVIFAGDASDLTIKRGTDLMAMFTGAQISKLEDEVLAMIEAGAGHD